MIFLIIGLIVIAIVYLYLRYKIQDMISIKTKKNYIKQENKGTILENELADICTDSDIHVIQNILIPNVYEKTTEIDLLVLCKKGMFCIEAKNYSGFIVGKRDNKQWTVYYNKYCSKTFYNPIKQNLGHIKSLQKMFPNLNFTFENLVVFGKKTTFSKNVLEFKEIMRLSDFADFIKKELPLKEDIYTQDEVECFYNYFQKIYTNGNMLGHIEYLDNYNVYKKQFLKQKERNSAATSKNQDVAKDIDQDVRDIKQDIFTDDSIDNVDEDGFIAIPQDDFNENSNVPDEIYSETDFNGLDPNEILEFNNSNFECDAFDYEDDEDVEDGFC